jgi:hypothetical protein
MLQRHEMEKWLCRATFWLATSMHGAPLLVLDQRPTGLRAD